MARAPIVAMDFLGVGNIPVGSRDNEMVADEDHTTFVKPTRSSVPFANRGFWTAPVDRPGGPAELFMTCQGYQNQQSRADSDNQQPFCSPKGKVGAFAARVKSDETRGERISGKSSASSEKTPLIKPLEELTEEDIMQLTREDCRRYLKEKGMRRPSWNKSQAIQQVLSLKGLIDSKGDEESKCKRPALDVEPPHVRQALPPQPQHAMPTRMQQDHRVLPSAMPQVFSSHNVTSGRMPEAHTQSCRPANRQPPKDGQDTKRSNQMCQSSQLGAGTEGIASVIPQLAGLSSSLPSFIKSSRSLAASACTTPETVLSAPLQMKGGFPSQGAHPQHVSTSGSCLPNVTGKQPTAQLTIFYSGMVNVYDDVPADKAHAIMRLAGRDNSGPLLPWNCNPCTVTSALDTCFATATSPPANISATVSACYSVDSISASLSSGADAVLSSGSIQQVTGATQPEARPLRKASLQRFLEKRKDRFRTRLPYTSSKKPVCDVFPQLDLEFPIKNRERTISTPLHHQLPSTLSLGQTQSSGSETSSPTRPPQTPQQTSSEEKGSCGEKRPSSYTGGYQGKLNSAEMEACSPSQQITT